MKSLITFLALAIITTGCSNLPFPLRYTQEDYERNITNLEHQCKTLVGLNKALSNPNKTQLQIDYEKFPERQRAFFFPEPISSTSYR